MRCDSSSARSRRVGTASSCPGFMRECQPMRRVTAMLSVAAVVLMAAGLVAQTKPSFAGEWKMLGDLVGPEGDLTITQDATTMTLEGGDQTPAPVKLTYKLDGSVSKNMMPG